MSALLPGVRPCNLCGADGRCFDLKQALSGSTDGTVGCMSCLRAGRFGFSHITEAGYLDANGLTWYEEDDEAEGEERVFVVDPSGNASAAPIQRPRHLPPTVPSGAVDELRRTPDFPTWNEVAWRVHCGDFMVYLGPWQPRDIRRAALAQQRQPRELFLEMTQGTDESLWPEETGEWHVTFHAFRCTGCGTHRGDLDLD